MDASEGVVRLAADHLHLLRLGGEVESEHPVARRLVRSAVIDGISEAGFLKRDRRIGHHRRSCWYPSEDSLARCGQIVDYLDAESVLLQRNHGRRQRFV